MKHSHPDSPAAVAAKKGCLPKPAMTVWSGVAVSLLAVILLVVGLGVGSLPWLCSNPALLSSLIARAVPGLLADVSIGSARIGWAGPILLSEVRIVPRSGGQPPVSIKRIEGSHGLAGMLLSLGDLGRLRLEGLEVNVAFDANRQSNLQPLFLPVSAASTAEKTGIVSAPQQKQSPVHLQLAIDDAIVRISGPWSPKTWVSDPIDVRASLAPSEHGPYSEWSIEPVQLLKEASLEASVAQGVLVYIAPVMAEATRTAGRFSLRIDEAILPVGHPISGTLSGVLAMHAVDLGPGPLVKNIITALPGKLQLPESIRIADESIVAFRLAEQRIWHKGLTFGVPLAKSEQRLDVHSSGSVGVLDRSIDVKLTLPIPIDLPPDRPLLAALAGKTFTISIGGLLGEPKVNFEDTLRATAGTVVADVIDRLRAPDRLQPPDAVPPLDQPPATPADSPTAKEKTGPTTDAIIDLVGGVFDEVVKRRAEKQTQRQAAETANPQPAPPPRRGRLLKKLASPPADQPPQP